MAGIIHMSYVHWVNDKPRVRMRVPADLQPILGKREITKVLATRDENEAKHLAIDAVAAIRQQFKVARQFPGLSEITLDREIKPIGFKFFLAKLDELLPSRYAEIEKEPVPHAEYEDVLQEWAREKSIGPKELRQRTEIMREFCANVGKTNLAEVVETDLVNYRAQLVARIGSNFSATSASKRLAGIKTIFKHAHEDTKILTENPAAKIKNIGFKKRIRDAFEPEERTLLLRKAATSDVPIIKWANLFGGYLGLRMAEIAEAQTSDFKQTPHGWVFEITEDDREENQTLKTPQSKRRLPLPEPILRAGFVSYLQSLKPGPLFPSVKLDQDGRRNLYASNEVGKWLRKLIPAQRKSFHSWRSTVRTMLEDYVSPDRARWIVGHKPRDIDAGHYLKHPVPALKKALRRLDDPLAVLKAA